MDIAERRASQDGKIRRRFEGQTMEFRCATAPGKFGEKMVMRFLNSNADMLSLDVLISNEKVRQDFRSIINEANGIIIVSGPTGSGKSTTLASALREKDNGELNIVTAEDPIEYDLGGNIQQFPVIRAKGQTFSNLLRTFLRQDPDVILIGETRDPETAESSMVRIWRFCVSKMQLIKAANVVDLPEPVGPVQRTRPLCLWVRSINGCGKPRFCHLGKLSGRIRRVRHRFSFAI